MVIFGLGYQSKCDHCEYCFTIPYESTGNNPSHCPQCGRMAGAQILNRYNLLGDLRSIFWLEDQWLED